MVFVEIDTFSQRDILFCGWGTFTLHFFDQNNFSAEFLYLVKNATTVVSFLKCLGKKYSTAGRLIPKNLVSYHDFSFLPSQGHDLE